MGTLPDSRKRGRPKGTPRTGGRKKGTPNKITRDVREVAQDYSAKAIEVLAEIMQDKAAPPAARVAAAIHLLDRAHGKPQQQVDVGLQPIYAISDQPMTEQEWAKKFASQDESSLSGVRSLDPKLH